MKKLLLIALIVVVAIVSCKKNETASVSSSEPKLKLSKSGFIKFRDLESFKSTLESLKEKNAKQLAEWEKQIGINSLRAKFLELEETDSQELNPVEEPYFAAVINNKGIYSIGSEIHVITYEKEYLVSGDSEQDLQNILNGKKQLSANVKAFTIERKILGSASASDKVKSNLAQGKTMSGARNSIMWTGDRKVIEPECGNNGRPERVKLMAFVNNYASYGIVGVKILGEAYRKGGVFGSRAWRSDETQYGKIEGAADFTFANAHYYIPYSVEGSDNDDIRKTIYDYYTTPFYSSLNANFIDATYTYQKNDACSLTTKFIRHQ